MKKFAFSILSLFMILGGVFLSACDKDISLSLLSPQEVVIYTNDEQAENYQLKEIDVKLENSSAGIGVDIINGGSSIGIEEKIRSKGNGRYAFNIYGKKSGEAEIKIYAKDNPQISKKVYITVNTLLEELTTKAEDVDEQGSERFVVKGVEKKLEVLKYFDFEPVTANISDVNWTFTEFDLQNRQYKTTLTNAYGDVIATLDDGMLKVEENYVGDKIPLRASFVENDNISNIVELDVLENSTVDTLVVSSEQQGELTFVASGEKKLNVGEFYLKRNDSNRSKASGMIVVNTNYDVKLDLIVYQEVKDGIFSLLPADNSEGNSYKNYFTFNVTSSKKQDNKTTCTFDIDVLDDTQANKSGTFYIYLKVKYVDYAYSITTGKIEEAQDNTPKKSGVDIVVDSSYSATRIELLNESGDGINNSLIDIFSSYEESNGYKISSFVLPDEIEIDNENFYISIDVGQASLAGLTLDENTPINSIASFYCQGAKLNFVQQQGSDFYRSYLPSGKSLTSGATLEVVSAGNFDIVENVMFDFVAESNPSVAKTSLAMNFYKVSIGNALTVKKEDGNSDLVKKYLSSDVNADRQIDYRLRLKGLSTVSGLTLNYDQNEHFIFSSLEKTASGVDAMGENYVDVAFSVMLNGANFEDTTSFWFEHITGKKSVEYEIEAFIPLKSVSIQNGDKSSADVYVDDLSTQAFVVDQAGNVTESDTISNQSLSKLTLEAGTSLPLNINYSQATLDEYGFEYRFLSFETLISSIKVVEGIADDAEALLKAEEYFASGNLPVELYYNPVYFAENDGKLFTIGEDYRLYLNNNNTFKGFVAVLVRGFDENLEDDETRNDVCVLRVFALESFFSVRYLSSNIKATTLYTTETLTAEEFNRAYVDVKIALRPDDNIPTYSGDVSSFAFKSANGTLEGADQNGYFVANVAVLPGAVENSNATKNEFYRITNIVTTNSGRYLEFRIIADSTNMQTSVNDVLTIVYADKNGNARQTDIQISIKNVNRVESVQWLNQTQDNEIYLNLTTTIQSERNFTISTSVLPSDANNIGLSYYYFANKGDPKDLAIATSMTGQTFNLNINTKVGGYGELYLLPKDMIKIVDGIEQFLYYFYSEDKDGNLIETAYYQPVSQLKNFYEDLLNGNDEKQISNYFLNNNGEKIYYQDLLVKIYITIADGNSEGTAIRIYNSADFKELDYAKYYKVMNNITFDGWKTNTERTFSGMLFGKDETITLNFGGNFASQPLFNSVSGTIKNLTFAGTISDAGLDTRNVGFVANVVETSGLLENVAVDVYYDSTSASYVPSSLLATTRPTDEDKIIYVGGVVGKNYGTLKQVYNNAMNIAQTSLVAQFGGTAFVGGLAGYNSGKILHSGVEFYDFVGLDDDEKEIKTPNKFKSVDTIGGIVGYLDGAKATIENSYVYAYPLTDGDDYSTIFDANTVSAFVGKYNYTDATTANPMPKVVESFAFAGNLETPATANNSDIKINFKNSYITYYKDEIVSANPVQNLYTRLFVDERFAYLTLNGFGQYYGSVVTTYEGNQYLLKENDMKNASDKWNALTHETSYYYLGGEDSVWEIENIDSEVNFGFMHLKNTTQSAAIDVSEVSIKDVIDDASNIKALKADANSGILFAYTPTSTISSVAENSALTELNTISISDLFGVSKQKANSLLVSSENNDIVINSNSIRVLRKSNGIIKLKVHSKMDMSQHKELSLIVLNFLPELKTTINGNEVKNNQIVMLQTGLANARAMNFSTNNVISLNGNLYATEKETFDIEYVLEDNKTMIDDVEKDALSVTKSNSALVLRGLNAKNSNVMVNASIKLDSLVGIGEQLIQDCDTQGMTNSEISTLKAQLEEKFHDAISNVRNRSFEVSIYDGATAISIDNASNLTVKPNEYAEFDVVVVTDNEAENIVLSLSYDGVEIQNSASEAYEAEFVVDSKLVLQASWSRSRIGQKTYNFKVLVKIKGENKHLIDKEYEGLTISIVPESQKANSNFVRTVGLKVKTQEIDDFSITTYSVQNRQIRNSVLYFSPSSSILNSLSPSSDAIVAVTVSPEFALMTHFTLTYESSGEAVGVVTLSKLSKNNYGYYLDSKNTTYIQNGLRVDFTEDDRTGDGVFYFRMYISSQFEAESDLRLKLTFFYESRILVSGTHNLKVDNMSEASVKVNGSSTVILAKGSTATVTIRTSVDQSLYNLYLQNSKSNITLSDITYEVSGKYKIYTATLSAGVNATLQSGDHGIFYVCAQVERIKNNIQEIKTSEATICLVDFAFDIKADESGKVLDGINVSSSGATTTYNGNTYDVYQTYLNESTTLLFDYDFAPEEYVYNSSDQSQVEAVEKLLNARSNFETTHTYSDKDSGYYVNCNYNENSGLYVPTSLKQQLWYASSEESSWKVYNENYDLIINNDMFTIDCDDSSGSEQLVITGKRTGSQLMKLQTTIVYNGIEFVYDYYFVIQVSVWSDEESPTQITSGEQFVEYIRDSKEADDYILMNDIVLDNYTPLNTDLVNSLDGNGFTIHLNSFEMPSESTYLNLALFDTVQENSTLKNIKVNIYNGGQIFVNYKDFQNVNIAGFALTNKGVIYNCEVLSYYDEDYSVSRISADNGLVVKFTEGNNTTPINLMPSMGVTSKVAGFVITNDASIVNSRVGGEEFMHIVKIAGRNYVKTDALGTFVIEGQGEVAGFVIENNSSGNISSCFVDNAQINNFMTLNSVTAGFVVSNSNSIQNSYVEGVDSFANGHQMPNNVGSNISAQGVIAGFVYRNGKLIKNSYANIAIENSNSRASMSAGFVYENMAGAEVTLCYSACTITKNDINQMQFSGVNEDIETLNKGEITTSYYYNESRVEDTNQSAVTTGVLSVTNVDERETFYGFSFASKANTYDGIWTIDDEGIISLVSANQIALSNRYAVTTNGVTSIFYSNNILDADTMKYLDLSYGSKNNPIIIRNEVDFAKATGRATDKEISAYKEYYNDNEVFGNYRIVNDIDMSQIDQNADKDGAVKLRTTNKTFSGLLDGNGFTISNINLGSNDDALENFGLFAKLDGAVVINLNLTVDSVHNDKANIVGTLAGTAKDSQILAITLSPVEVKDNAVGQTSILGKNVVGGVVGMIFGESRLYDIKVENIDVYSSSYNDQKTVGSNDSYTGENLRNSAEKGVSLKSLVQNISYAGGIAGYVDIYNLSNKEDYAIYDSTYENEDYDIVTVHVTNSVDIYGEVAGGLFGYVGNSTLIYDAKIELNAINAGKNKPNPSYIISKNLYAGGLVGENYGGLFAVSAEYSSNIQQNIEDNEHEYYTNSVAVERGQQTIFSYEETDADYGYKHNAPKYIGGLVGYMGGGYIYIGYSKLNVIAHSANTKDNLAGEKDTVAVGGLIGLARAKGGYEYNLPATVNNPSVNIYLNEVYASGDVYAETKDSKKGYAGGLIGALDAGENGDTKLALRYALALNYYSYNGQRLLGDNNIGISDKHSSLVGKLYYEEGKSLNEGGSLTSNLYLINNDRGYYNVYTKQKVGTEGVGSLSVGGYSKVEFKDASITINAFGWQTSATEMQNQILEALPMGNVDNNTIASRYAKFSNYFLPLGWNDEFWAHEEGLFPEIILKPRLNIVYLDVDNKIKTLNEINQDSNAIVVVRGRYTHADGTVTYQDIDLRPTQETDDENRQVLSNAISGFRGTLISYREYMNSAEEGVLNDYGNTEGVGGELGDDVGLIIEDTLFESLDSARIESLNIYMCESSGEGTANYNLATGETTNTIFRNLNIVLNVSVELTGEGRNITNPNAVKEDKSDAKEYSSVAGLISNYARETSFIDINIKARLTEDSTYASITLKEASANAVGNNSYFGVLAGYVEQTSAFTPIAIQGLSFEHEVKSETSDTENLPPIQVNVEYADTYVYAGLYAGRIAKAEGNKAEVTIGLNELDNVVFNLKTESGNPVQNLLIGGFIGEAFAIDTIELSASKIENPKGVDIVLHDSCNELYAGLAFGRVAGGSSIEMEPSTGICALTGGIYQIVEAQEENLADGKSLKITNNLNVAVAKIGGIVGEANSTFEVSSISVNLNVGGYWGAYKGTSYNDDYEDIFEQNLYDYSDKLNSFVINPHADNAIGGFVGYAKNNVYVSGTCEVTGIVDVKTTSPSEGGKITNIGGLIGKTLGLASVNTTLTNTMKISAIEEDGNLNCLTTNIGGVIGHVANAEGGNNASSNKNVTIEGSILVNDIVLSSVSNLNYGGAIGYVERQDWTDKNKAVTIQDFVYGGAVKIYDCAVNDNNDNTSLLDLANINVGGVVGKFKMEQDQPEVSQTRTYSISDSKTYGDVFVIYKPTSTAKLGSYNFGGIVGSGAYLKIENCSTLMTSFNTKLTGTNLSDLNIGAIAGQNSGVITYSKNKYSSGVNLAYQEEAGNDDLAYGATEMPYKGYTSTVNAEYESTNNILDKFIGDTIIKKVFGYGFEIGHKLNPLAEELLDNETINNNENLKGKLHNIAWVALIKSSSRNNVLADNLTNIVLVGNGQTIARSDSNNNGPKVYDVVDETKNLAYGGVVNSLGQADFSSEEATFSAISAMVVDLSVNVDLDTSIDNKTVGNYGGLVGAMYANSIVYAVGVKGDLSVGGANQSLRLAGIAGWVCGGLIEQCYVDADMIYRANTGGMYSGIANFSGEHASFLRSSYSAGIMESYVGLTAYTLAYSNNDSNQDTILDCYTYTQSKFTNVLGEKLEVVAYNTNCKTLNNTQVIDSSWGAGKPSTNTDDLSLSYDSTVLYGWNSIYVQTSNKATATDAYTKWYFNPYVNNGYASHGFGFLKNVTVYTRVGEDVKTSVTGKAEAVAIGTKEYAYTPASYSSLFSDSNLTFINSNSIKTQEENVYAQGWFFAVPNMGKLNQMINVVSNTYTQNYRFFLQYSFEIADNSYLNKSIGIVDVENLIAFEFDGNNQTLSKINTTLFNEINGNVENLRLTDVEINGSSNGVLANTLNGDITNVTAIGNLQSSATVVGGIVGTLNGNAIDVDNVVNVSSTANGAQVGGIAGNWTATSKTISYSTNAGQITLTGVNGDEDSHVIAGGLIGTALAETNKGEISNSYNANSVLAGYTKDKSTADDKESAYYVAGGIVGSVENITLDSCYNTGLVGAGNYKNINTAYAGGIFGLGSAVAINCINDGPVEALSDMSDISATVSINGGASSLQDAFTDDPKDYVYKVSMKYSDKDRRVFANPIGEGLSDDSKGNFSSTNNIKNDGWIKPADQEISIILDRKSILDAYDNKLVQGKFVCEEILYCNGYDSYGFVNRVYLKDTMIRKYNTNFMFGTDDDGGDGNGAVTDDHFTAIGGSNGYVGHAINNNGKWVLEESAINSYGMWGNAYLTDIYGQKDAGNGLSITNSKGETITATENEVMYQFASKTEYYSYGTFETYESLLDAENATLGNIKALTNDISTYIDKIDEYKSNNETIQPTTVNGSEVGVVYNERNLTSVLSPFKFTYQGGIEITESEDILNGINSENVQFKLTGSDGSNIQTEYVTVQFSAGERTPNGDGTMTQEFDIVADFYFGSSISVSEVQATITYTKTEKITLQDNNVIDDGKIKILWTEPSNVDGTSTTKTSKISLFEDENMTGTPIEFEGKIVRGSGGEDGYVEVTGATLSAFEGKYIQIEYWYTQTEYVTENILLDGDDEFSSYNGSGEQTVQNMQTTVTFKSYKMTDVDLTWADTTEDDAIIGKKLDLSTLLESLQLAGVDTSQNFALQNNHFALSYANGNWSVYAGDEDIGVMNGENYLYVESENYVDTLTQTIVYSKIDLTADVERFAEEKWIQGENQDWQLTYHVETTENFGIADNKPIYLGSNIAGDATVVDEVSIAGMTFANYQHTYINKYTLTLKSPYEVGLKDSTGAIIKQFVHSSTTQVQYEWTSNGTNNTKLYQNKITDIFKDEVSTIGDEDSLKIFVGTDDEPEVRYEVEKGVIAEGDREEDAVQINYVKTTKYKNDIPIYEVVIYDNDKTEVGYFTVNETGNDAENEPGYDAEKTKQYVYDFANNRLYLHAWNADGDNWSETGLEIDMNYNYLNDATIDVIVGDFVGTQVKDGETITANCNITFLRKTSNLTLQSKVLKTYDVTDTWGPVEAFVNQKIDRSDYQDVVEGSLQYKKGSSSFVDWENDESSLTGAGDYTVVYRLEFGTNLSTESEDATESEDNSSIQTVILGNDLYLGDRTFGGKNERTIIGNAYSLRYAVKAGAGSNVQSFFETNSAQISDLTFIGQMSRATSYYIDVALFALSNEANISNFNIYGGIRNACHYQNTTVYSTIKETTANISGNSYVFIRGLDGENETTQSYYLDYSFVNVKLSNKITVNDDKATVSMSTHDIIVAGDGKDGTKGADGKKSESIKTYGTNGEVGGKGGAIDVVDSNQGYSRAGIGGMGGYGGIGADGYYSNSGRRAIGGFGGGAAGSNGINGDQVYDSESRSYSETKISLTSRGRSDEYKTVYAGNGGVGGRGRIGVIGSTLYYATSGGGGAAGAGKAGNGDNGTTYGKAVSGSAKTSIFFNAGGTSAIADDTHHVDTNTYTKKEYKIDEWDDTLNRPKTTSDVAYEQWRNNVKTSIENDVTSNAGKAGSGGSASGGQVKSQHMFVRIEVRLSVRDVWYAQDFLDYGFWGKFQAKVKDYRKYVWTSGETFNSGGSAGVVGSDNKIWERT